MPESIQVYPKAIVFCPKSQTEQPLDICASCERFIAFDRKDGRFFLDCIKG